MYGVRISGPVAAARGANAALAVSRKPVARSWLRLRRGKFVATRNATQCYAARFHVIFSAHGIINSPAGNCFLVRVIFVSTLRILLAVAVLVARIGRCAQVYRYRVRERSAKVSVNVSQQCRPATPARAYLTGFDSQTNSDYFEMQVDVPMGCTKCGSAIARQFGPRRVTTTGSTTNTAAALFDQSSTFTADRAGLFNLTGGTNTLGICENWGFYDIDYLEFRPFTPPRCFAGLAAA